MSAERDRLLRSGDGRKARRKRRSVRWYYRRATLLHPRHWWRERCCECGSRLYWSESAISAPGTGLFHDRCHALWRVRLVARERFAVLQVVAEVWDIDSLTVQELMAGRARADLADESNARNLAWRVFYDLANAKKRASL